MRQNATIGIETGRYSNLPLEERVCFHCKTIVEDECHVILHCPLYESIRQGLFEKCISMWPGFMRMTVIDFLLFFQKLNVLFLVPKPANKF